MQKFRGLKECWPAVLRPKALTIEEFAVELIVAARAYLQALQNSTDKWHQATKSTYFGKAMYRFNVEYEGIATQPEQAIKVATGAQKGHEIMAKVVEMRRQAVRRLRD